MALTLPTPVTVGQVDTATRYNSDIDYLLRAGFRRLSSFPTPTDAGELFWHTGYTPNRLYMWGGSQWNLLIGQVAARKYNSASYGLGSGSTTQILLNNTRFDTDSMATVAGRITIASGLDGLYDIKASVSFASNPTGARAVQIWLNGGATIPATTFVNATNGFSTDIVVSTTYRLVAGDYVQMAGFQNSGGSINIVAAAPYSPELTVTRIDM